jgi:hypothetical protein
MLWPQGPWGDRILYWGLITFVVCLVDFAVVGGHMAVHLLTVPREFFAHILRTLVSSLPRYVVYGVIVAGLIYLVNLAVINIADAISSRTRK